MAVLLLAAHARGLRVDLRGGPAVEFGEGALQRLSHSSITDGESMAAARLSRHTGRTARRLEQLGLPVPRHSSVRSGAEALAAARRVGWPVVVKPMSGKQGRGVTVGVGHRGIVCLFSQLYHQRLRRLESALRPARIVAAS